jgi:hypothetical protein
MARRGTILAQELLGARLGAQLERCSWNNFLEVPSWKANPKRSASCSKCRRKPMKHEENSSSFASPLLALTGCWLLQATGQARRWPAEWPRASDQRADHLVGHPGRCLGRAQVRPSEPHKPSLVRGSDGIAESLTLPRKTFPQLLSFFWQLPARVNVVCTQCDLPVEGFSACAHTNELIICQGMARMARIAVCRCEAREL